MSKKTFIHAENNNKILSSNEVKLYVPPEPEKMKIIIWGKELCNIAEWNDFLKCVEEKTRENDLLKQQLAEKDTRIEELEGQFAYECECNKQLVDLQKQLEEKQKTIDEINKEFVQAVHDWKALCAEKDKEIEMLNTIKNNAIECAYLFKVALSVRQKDLAIQELEKVKEWLEPKYFDYEQINYLSKIIDQQIKELKGDIMK